MNREKRAATHLYVIGPESGATPVKIGVARDPLLRLTQLQCGSPVRLKIYVVWAFSCDPRRAEVALHFTLERRRLHGEWFDMTPDEVVKAFDEYADRLAYNIDKPIRIT